MSEGNAAPDSLELQCDEEVTAVIRSRQDSSDDSSSDRSRATSPASTDEAGNDDIHSDIGCIPEEAEDEEAPEVSAQTPQPPQSPPKSPPAYSGSQTQSSPSSRTDMDLLKAILHDEAADDVIPEETSSQAAESAAKDRQQIDEEVKEVGDKESEHDEVQDATAASENTAAAPESVPLVEAEAEAEAEENQAEIDQAEPDSQPTQEAEADADAEAESKPVGKKRRKKQSANKKQKKQQKQLGPVAPWSRASIHTFSRPSANQQQQQPLASDRSVSSIGVGSRGSRATSAAMSAKEMREKYRPVSNEEKMAQRLSEIDSLLARDYANEAKLAYQRSVAECRQAWQNYASTARIMGHVTDQAQTADSKESLQHQNRRPIPDPDREEIEKSESLRRNHPLGSRVAPELDRQQYPRPHRRIKIAAPDAAEPAELNSISNKENTEDEAEQLEDRPGNDDDASAAAADDEEQRNQPLHGYRVGAPQRMAGRFGSDHKLSESDNPDVRAWLREKNRSDRRQRREFREAKRREMQARLDAQQMKSERRQEAEAAFLDWAKRKREQQLADAERAPRSGKNGRSDSRAGQRQSGVPEQPLPLSDQEAAFAALESRPRQGGPRPAGSAKPVHNSVFKRSPAILGTAGASFSGRQVRMGVIGQHVEASSSSQQQQQQQQQLAIEQQPQTRLSFDEWSQRKSEQLAVEQRRQREAERQRREAAAAADPQMSALVPQLARRRIRTATELKQRRTDTGLGLGRPRTAGPALAPPQTSTAQRPSTGRAALRASSLERREASITDQLPNPFVPPAEDEMLNRMLSGQG